MRKPSMFPLLSLALLAGACNNNSSSATPPGDSAVNKTVPAPVDNSNATNPSLADTAYPKKDTMKTSGDSARRQK